MKGFVEFVKRAFKKSEILENFLNFLKCLYMFNIMIFCTTFTQKNKFFLWVGGMNQLSVDRKAVGRFTAVNRKFLNTNIVVFLSAGCASMANAPPLPQEYCCCTSDRRSVLMNEF